jgi:anti-sigma B factor antagonist
MLHHSLDIHQRENQGVTILDLHGKLDMGRGDNALRDFVCALQAQGNRQLILGLAHVSEIDTAGSGALLFLAQEYQASGGKLVLLQVDHAHTAISELARLEATIQFYATEVDAVNSFFPDRAIVHYDILDYVESHSPDEDPGQDKDHQA